MFDIALIIAVIIALTQLFKKLAFVPAKYIPLITLLMGLFAGFFYVDVPTIEGKIMYGLMIGLAAAGLFDQTKIITKK